MFKGVLTRDWRLFYFGVDGGVDVARKQNANFLSLFMPDAA